MRETVDLPERFYELYVVDKRPANCSARSRSTGCCGPNGRFRLSDLMDQDRRMVRATDDQEEVARQFERYNLVAAPVVDENDRLVGVLTFDDIVDVIEQEAEEDIKALGGVGAMKSFPTRFGPSPKAASPGSWSISLTALLAAWVIEHIRAFDREDGGACRADADRRARWAAMPARRP